MLTVVAIDEWPSKTRFSVLVCEFLIENMSNVFRSSVAGGTLQQMFKTVHKNEVSAATHRKLKMHLRLEYDFYYFVKQRFYNLLSRIRALRKQRDIHRQLTDWWSPGKPDDPRLPVPGSHNDASDILSQDKNRTRKFDDRGIA